MILIVLLPQNYGQPAAASDSPTRLQTGGDCASYRTAMLRIILFYDTHSPLQYARNSQRPSPRSRSTTTVSAGLLRNNP